MIQYSLFLTILIFSNCGNSNSSSKPSQIPNKQTLDIVETKDQQVRPNLEGLYLNNWNQSGIIVIHNEKIHHFTRREFTSIYKDEEYDFKGLNSEGKINIIRRYYLDRNGKTLSKETVLYDIEPIYEDGKIISLIRNGRTFTKMADLRTLLITLTEVDLDSFTERYLSETNSQNNKIKKALDQSTYYIQSGLPFRQLRDGQIEFYDIFKNVILSE